MDNKTMNRYLSDIKTKVDLIAAAGSLISTEDIIFYILNGLPSSYQSFKIVAIHINLKPLVWINFTLFYSAKKSFKLLKLQKVNNVPL